MKNRKSYQEEVDRLFKAIDLSIEAYTKYLPEGWTGGVLKMVISNLEDQKKRILGAEKKFRTIASLKYEIEAVFTYFQEASGEAVEYFWKRINEEGLAYERENKLEKILKRGKIRGRIEYDYVNDIIVVAEQTGLTTIDETRQLSQMLGEYEAKKKK
ncbi:hypothetical protein [Pontibacter mangrovi]|uniref:Uncharacterized protein n=1 Tax=Pontibacter mangrovi TaxID=2589816 RepID=A0A501VY24_9BACT|nr:hypothetical protein [Pontibacter mangrovi]TPE42633.1 hypothetical protein FJM65_17625 [Pontibacter mangrovi]